MQRAILCLSSLLVAVAAFTPAISADDLQSGLVGEYFSLEKGLGDADQPPSQAKPFYVRIDKQVNFADAGQEFHGTKLADHFCVRWTGVIQIEKAGNYSFYTYSDDGSRLYINDKLVVENWGPHGMTKKSGEVELTAGRHEILIAFEEISGGAGCIVGWTPPGGKEEVLPADVLFHAKGAANIAWDEKAWKKKQVAKNSQKKPGGSGVPFDYAKYGPYVGAALHLGEDRYGANIVHRGYIIRLDETGDACIVFDADTMRMAAGWTDGGLVLGGLPFTGGHGQFPYHNGPLTFRTAAAPGWASGGKLDDPRDSDYPPLGPLPKDWAQFQGLYLHGNQVIVNYTVGAATVLETATLATHDEHRIIQRNIQIESAKEPLTLVLADVQDENEIDGAVARLVNTEKNRITLVGVASEGKQPELEIADGQLLLHLPQQEARQFHVRYWYGDAAGEKQVRSQMTAGKSLDVKSLTTGGPARWGEPLVSEGELSTDDESPYVIDRITVPYKNPFGSQMRIGGFDFFSDGTSAAISTWGGEVWIVRGIDEDLDEITWQRFATGVHEPLGLKIVDDVIYTVSDDQITRYHDLNEDGEADFYENFNNDWELTSGFHAFCFDLHTDDEGNFYFAFGSPVRPGGGSFERMGLHHGSIIKVSKDGSKLERYATGLRAPNGMCVGPNGQVTSGDNEGTFVPRCPIHWIDQGEFLGVVDSYEHYDQLTTTATVSQRNAGRKKTLDPSEMPQPLAWLPKNVDNSGGGQAWVTSDRWGPFAGELLHMSYGRSALYLVMKEQIDTTENGGELMQGGVVQFPVRFTSSAMRARFNPRDGQLYVSGLRGWQTNAAKNGGLDRVRYTGQPVYMPSGLKVKSDGIEISFTQELDPESAADPDNYAVDAADIKWTQGYGSKEYEWGQRDLAPNKWRQGWAEMYVDDARLLPDGKTVFLEMADIEPVHLMKIQFQIDAADGTPIKSEIWNTIHAVD